MNTFDIFSTRLKPASLLLLGLLLAGCSDSDSGISFENADPFAVPDSLVEIYAPMNGARLPANEDFILDYAVVRGADGAYVRIRIDKLRSVKVTSLASKHHMHGLPPGPHRINIRIYDRDGTFTGGMAEIQVYME